LMQIMKRLISPAMEQFIPKFEPLRPPSEVLRLTLDQAMGLFLKQNLDLIMVNYGIDAAKGRQITARLFPNPTLAVNTLSAYTQDCNMDKCGAVAPTLSQLFEVAGRRGFRIRSAELDTLSAEARFEDAVRQLGFTFKETYFRVQRRRGHLAIDQDVLDSLVKLLPGTLDKTKRTGSELDRVRVGLLTVNSEALVLQDVQELEEVSGDLRMMLRLLPDVEFDLQTELTYYRPMIQPNLTRLLEYALENRPDIRALRFVRDKRKTELQLARAIRYPNVTAQLGYSVQGPQGPDNQQQWGLGLSAPLPVFDRNQGGIVEAQVAVRTAETDIEKTTVMIQNEVAVAYRKFLQSQKLVEATNGAIERASLLFRTAQQGYAKNEIGILDLESMHRAYADTKESHLDAVFGYQQSVLNLERSSGRDVMF
jgi:outer membrane protein, heavy metal efflux system